MGNAGAEVEVAAAAASGAAEDGPGSAVEAEAHGTWGGATSKTCELAHYDQDPTKLLVQTGREVAPSVAPAIVCATKPTWNMKRWLEWQQEQEWRRENQREQYHFRYIGRGVCLVDSAREKNKRAQWLRGPYPFQTWAILRLTPL